MAGVTAGYSSFTLGPGEDYGIFLTLTITESSGRVIGALSRRIAIGVPALSPPASGLSAGSPAGSRFAQWQRDNLLSRHDHCGGSV